MRNFKQPSQKGFNLIEVAIVLGVIGLVIGGIWVAAASISLNMKINETVEAVMEASDRLRQLYPPTVAATINDSMPLTESQLLTMGIFPETWRLTAGSFTFLKNPFGIMNVSGRTWGGAGNSHIHHWRVSQSNKEACIRMLLAFSRLVPDHIYQISTDTVNPVTLPVNTNQASTACNSGSQLTVSIKVN